MPRRSKLKPRKNKKPLQKKLQSDATKVLAKVRPLINNVAELKREEHVDDMPKTIVNKMFSELAILSNFEKDAREKIGSTATSLNFNMDDVTKGTRAIVDTMNTVKTMLKQTAKLF